MSERYRLTAKQKEEVAQNLIDILDSNSEITALTRDFVYTWVRRPDGQGKEKAFSDVWDIVLKKYMPGTRPVLFRSCNRRSGNGKIESFTSSFDCAKRISEGKGALIICDTKDSLRVDELRESGEEYKSTFYPLVDVLKKMKGSGRWIDEMLGEEEYIMRVDVENMHFFRWK